MGRYIPGYKDGGPIRSIVNLIDHFGDKFLFDVVCIDRDHGDLEPYPNISYEKSNAVGKAKVWYYSPNKLTNSYLLERIENADLIYVCGPYNKYSFKLLRLKKQRAIKLPIILASMGSFSQGALAIKSFKKRLYIIFLKSLGYFKEVIWSVTSEHEAKDLKYVFGGKVCYYIAQDLPTKPLEVFPKKLSEKKIKIIFLSRISPIKNLLFALDVLSQVKFKNIVFDIYGPNHDKKYWDLCLNKIDKLNSNFEVTYRGSIKPEQSMEVFSQYDVFLFPTLGENYGHVIYEALASGCIPIISDQTPWLDLAEHNAGYVFSLNEKKLFIQTVENLALMSFENRQLLMKSAFKYADSFYRKSIKKSGYPLMFNHVKDF